MKKLSQVGMLALALVAGYCARGASGCSSAGADGSGGAACECPAPTVKTYDLTTCDPNTHRGVVKIAGLKPTDLWRVSAVEVAADGTSSGPGAVAVSPTGEVSVDACTPSPASSKIQVWVVSITPGK